MLPGRCQVRKLDDPPSLCNARMELLAKLANHGLIHGYFNEFNLMVDDTATVTLIDFTQMASTTQHNASW